MTFCHRDASPAPRKHLHLECPECFERKEVASWLIGKFPPIRIWVCRRCTSLERPLADIVCDGPSMAAPIEAHIEYAKLLAERDQHVKDLLARHARSLTI